MTKSGRKFYIIIMAAIAMTSLIAGAIIFFKRASINSRGNQCYTLAILYAGASIAHEYVHAELLNQIKKDPRFKSADFTVSSVNDSINVTTMCEAALDSQTDLIVCVGQVCAQTLIGLAKKRKSPKPMIFLGVSNPVELGVADSLEKPGHNMTGVQSKPANKTFTPIKLLLYAKPTLKKLLVPYMTTTIDSPELAQEIKDLCAEKGVAATILPLSGISDPIVHITTMLPGHDALTYIEADGLCMYSPALGKLASQHNVTMFAASIDGQAQAALGYSSTPTCLAIAGFKLVKEILINKRNAGEIPVVDSPGFRELIINPHLFNEQDLKDINLPQVIANIKNDPELADVHELIRVN